MRSRHDLRYASGIFFISIAVGIASASYMSEVAYIYHASLYMYPLLWFSALALSIYLFRLKNPDIFKAIGIRFRQSTSWPRWAKAVNGLAWALPFLLIALYPADYPYLILLGIGCGNISTYILSRITESRDRYGIRGDEEERKKKEEKEGWEEHGKERIGADGNLGKEQFIVGLVSSSLLPVAMLVGSSSLLPADLLHMLSRLFIAVAYASGGIYALISDGC
ncbi:MAG: hypothetical protein QW178_00030 [Candidatus Nitrosocaldus sp.]